MKRRLSNDQKKLLTLLPELLKRYGDRRFLEGDPVSYVHQYREPGDQEMAAIISALLAFGNVKSVKASVGKVLAVMGMHPRAYVLGFDAEREEVKFRGVGHRWVRGDDLLLLTLWLQQVLKRHGSLKNCFLEDYRDSDPDVGPMLNRFSSKVLSYLPPLAQGRAGSLGFRYFFPAPRGGSPCKRMNMFLRWMVRPRDGIDLGLWPEIPPSKLVIPLDVHVHRFARKYRLSPFKNPRWEVATQVTEFLRLLSEEDPVKFDFPICHHGMAVGW